MATSYLIAHMVSGHDPPASSRFEPRVGLTVRAPSVLPAKADNLSAIHST